MRGLRRRGERRCAGADRGGEPVRGSCWRGRAPAGRRPASRRATGALAVLAGARRGGSRRGAGGRRSKAGTGCRGASAGRRAGRLAGWRTSATSAATRATRRSLRGRLGFDSQVSVIGPFGEGRASFANGFPPEPERRCARDLATQLSRQRARVAGERGTPPCARGDLSRRSAPPGHEAVAYVAAFVHSDRERAGGAAPRASPGPVQASGSTASRCSSATWCGRAALDQDAAAVRLGRGWNRILVKTVVADGPGASTCG